MELGEAILAVGAGDRAPSFELFSGTLDAAWIAQALEATGTATIRRRKLPAEYVVWLVIGMALLRDRSIREVVRHLDLVLPTRTGRGTVSGAAIAQARDRLGPEPLAALFAQTAAVWGPAAAAAARWRGLSVYGVDGTTVRVPRYGGKRGGLRPCSDPLGEHRRLSRAAPGGPDGAAPACADGARSRRLPRQ